MRSFLSICAIFLSCALYGQSKDDCLYVFYDVDSNYCGYLNAAGDTIIGPDNVACYDDTICSYGVVITRFAEAMAFNEKGEFLYDIFWFDNGPDYIEDGMFRIIKEGKIGYANKVGEVIIEPTYKCAWPFEDGIAQVAYECKKIQFDEEHWGWESDEWFYINKKGEIVEGK